MTRRFATSALSSLLLASLLALPACRPRTRTPPAESASGRDDLATTQQSTRPPTRSLALPADTPLADATIEIEIGPGARNVELTLNAEQALWVTADQQHGDVGLEIRPPSGKALVIDLPTRQTTTERLCFVATVAGQHELRLRPAHPRVAFASRIALSIRPATHADHACARAMRAISRGDQHASAGSIDEAFTDYREAAARAREADDPILEAAVRLQGLEIGERRRPPDGLTEAAEDGRTALRALGDDTAPELAILIRQRLANVERMRNRIEQAAQLFQESLTLAERHHDIPGTARAHTGLGRISAARGAHHEAVESFRRARDLWRQTDRPVDHALTLVHLAGTHLIGSDIATARDLLSEALLMLPTDEAASRLQVLVQKGWVDYLDGRNKAAIESYEDALRWVAPAEHSTDRGGILDRIASAERARGNLSRAEALFREVLAIFEHEGGVSVANTSLSLGELYSHQGRYQEARPLLQRALDTFTAHGNDNAIAHVLTTQSDLERGTGEFDAALATLNRAATLVEDRWQAAFLKGKLVRPTALIQDIDAKYVDLLVALAAERMDDTLAQHAFQRSDRARDRNLLALIGTDIERMKTATPAQAARRAQLHEAMEELEIRRDAQRDPATDRALRQLQAELDVIDETVRAAALRAPSYSTTPGVGQLQRQLPPGACLLSYVLGVDRSYLFMVGASTFETFALPGRERLEARASALVAALSLSDQRPAVGQADVLLTSTAGILLGPVNERLRNCERLVVVAEGALSRIPFGALPEAGVGAPLTDRVAVVQGPSFGVLAALGQRTADRGAPRGPIVAFADPVYAADDPRASGLPEARTPVVASLRSRRLWERLPATHDEASALEALAPGRVSTFLGFEASRDAALGGALARAAILHFAVHGDLDEAVPASSGLLLSRFDERGRRRPSHLRVRDIRSLRLEADLVVLSACQSAWDKPQRGDALMGLAQAFFVAGASRVLATLWPVDDQATAALMKSFYHHLLANGDDAATALRKAQNALRQTPGWHAPYYWAGFVLFDGWR